MSEQQKIDSEEARVKGKEIAEEAAKPKEVDFFELLIRDLTTDHEMEKVIIENTTALHGWLPGIGAMKTREVFKTYVTDVIGLYRAKQRHRQMVLDNLTKMREKWLKLQEAKSAGSASEPKSISEDSQSTFSAPAATEPAESQQPQS